MTHPHQPDSGQPSPWQGGPPAPRRGGVAVAALVVGIVSFVLGWLLVAGLVLGVAGVVLGVLSVRRGPADRTFGVIGLVLSSLATLTGLAVLALFVLGITGNLAGGRDGAAPTPPSDPRTAPATSSYQALDTPCYSFEGPGTWIDNQDDEATAGCRSTLQLWGSLLPDGTVLNEGVGEIYGSLSVEAVRTTTSDTYDPTRDAAATVTALEDTFIASLGTVTSLSESVQLDGREAVLTRVESDSPTTRTKALITVYGPQEYPAADEPVQLFLISFVVPDDSGDELIEHVVDTWRWN